MVILHLSSFLPLLQASSFKIAPLKDFGWISIYVVHFAGTSEEHLFSLLLLKNTLSLRFPTKTYSHLEMHGIQSHCVSTSLK